MLGREPGDRVEQRARLGSIEDAVRNDVDAHVEDRRVDVVDRQRRHQLVAQAADRPRTVEPGIEASVHPALVRSTACRGAHDLHDPNLPGGRRRPLERKNLDGWIATASTAGTAHLVPLSLAWDGQRLIVATEPDAVTTRNLADSGRARVGAGETRDVVMIDARLETSYPAEAAPAAIVDAYLAQSDWDPRDQGIPFVFSVLVPERIQAWREADEITGRTLMRGGNWLAD